jgi:DNA helicase-2/ATP-dependent DNA helicase PcrA
MRTGSPAKAVEIAIDGWYGDYLKGAFADYIDRLDELKALVGFASRFEEMQDLLAQIVLLNGETSDRQVDPTPKRSSSPPCTRPRASSTTSSS